MSTSWEIDACSYLQTQRRLSPTFYRTTVGGRTQVSELTAHRQQLDSLANLEFFLMDFLLFDVHVLPISFRPALEPGGSDGGPCLQLSHKRKQQCFTPTKPFTERDTNMSRKAVSHKRHFYNDFDHNTKKFLNGQDGMYVHSVEKCCQAQGILHARSMNWNHGYRRAFGRSASFTKRKMHECGVPRFLVHNSESVSSRYWCMRCMRVNGLELWLEVPHYSPPAQTFTLFRIAGLMAMDHRVGICVNPAAHGCIIGLCSGAPGYPQN